MTGAPRPDLESILYARGSRWPYRLRDASLEWLLVFVSSGALALAAYAWNTYGPIASGISILFGGAWVWLLIMLGRRWMRQKLAWQRADLLSRAAAHGYSEADVTACESRLDEIDYNWPDAVENSSYEPVQRFHRRQEAAITAVRRTAFGRFLVRVQSITPITGVAGLGVAFVAFLFERRTPALELVEVIGLFGMLFLVGSIVAGWAAGKLLDRFRERQVLSLPSDTEVSG